jgi:hypothetical protein
MPDRFPAKELSQRQPNKKQKRENYGFTQQSNVKNIQSRTRSNGRRGQYFSGTNNSGNSGSRGSRFSSRGASR